MIQTKTSRLLSMLFALALFFFILTFSISLPILIRPLYYAHIDAMDLPESSGFTRAQIVEGYDQVLDYLTIPGKDFETGVFAYSESGAAHFAECKTLFELNGGLLFASSVCLLILLLLRFMKKVRPFRLGQRSASFWSAISAMVLPLIIGGLAALDFDRAFTIFHQIFFPGKTNWLFDSHTDQIILVLPQDFFMHCAMLIGGGILTLSAGILLWEFAHRRKAMD